MVEGLILRLSTKLVGSSFENKNSTKSRAARNGIWFVITTIPVLFFFSVILPKVPRPVFGTRTSYARSPRLACRSIKALFFLSSSSSWF